jgi:hypothetical protein
LENFAAQEIYGQYSGQLAYQHEVSLSKSTTEKISFAASDPSSYGRFVVKHHSGPADIEVGDVLVKVGTQTIELDFDRAQVKAAIKDARARNDPRVKFTFASTRVKLEKEGLGAFGRAGIRKMQSCMQPCKAMQTVWFTARHPEGDSAPLAWRRPKPPCLLRVSRRFRTMREGTVCCVKFLLWGVPRGLFKGLKNFLKAILFNSPVLMIFPIVLALIPLICGQYIREAGATHASSSKRWNTTTDLDHSGIIPYGKPRPSTVPISN